MIKDRLKIFTWHIHGSYLYYLSQGNYDLIIPVDETKGEGYGGRGHTFLFGDNVIEVDSEDVKNMDFDCILFQSAKNYKVDQYDILSREQREDIPRIFLEHDPPRVHPTDTKHIAGNDPEIILVHVTPFNSLMWDNGVCQTKIIVHGVLQPKTRYSGEWNKGIVVVNNIESRGRRLGADIFKEFRKYIPLDLVGMNAQEYGGIGEIPLSELPKFLSNYRFFFNPIRYTSLGLAVCEAMMMGMPVIGLATTEMVSVIENGVSGYLSTDLPTLFEKMKLLLNNHEQAILWGTKAREYAEKHFDIHRFTSEWETLFQNAIKNFKYEKKNCIY